VRSPEAIAKSLAALVERMRRKIEPSLVEELESIIASINHVLPVLARGTMQMDGTSYTVRQIALEYLPTALNAYEKIPASKRQHRAAIAERTPLEDMQQRLAMIDTKMHDILVSVQQNDLRSLLDNGRMLKERLVSLNAGLAD
jgi:hypothetical protein